jgi:hypothetical protein
MRCWLSAIDRLKNQQRILPSPWRRNDWAPVGGKVPTNVCWPVVGRSRRLSLGCQLRSEKKLPRIHSRSTGIAGTVDAITAAKICGCRTLYSRPYLRSWPNHRTSANGPRFMGWAIFTAPTLRHLSYATWLTVNRWTRFFAQTPKPRHALKYREIRRPTALKRQSGNFMARASACTARTLHHGSTQT